MPVCYDNLYRVRVQVSKTSYASWSVTWQYVHLVIQLFGAHLWKNWMRQFREENSVHGRVIYTGVFLLTTDRHRFFIMPPCGAQLQTFIVPSVVVICVNRWFVSLINKRDDDYQVTIQPDDYWITKQSNDWQTDHAINKHCPAGW